MDDLIHPFYTISNSSMIKYYDGIPHKKPFIQKIKELWEEDRSFLGYIDYLDNRKHTEHFESLPNGYYMIELCRNYYLRIYSRNNDCFTGMEALYCDDLSSFIPEDCLPLDRGKCVFWKDKVNQLARKAIDTWSSCAIRLGLIRDMRIFIAKLLWNERHLWCP